MKIVCDACQAKYSISDDKVQGKVFKIRCKKCLNIIVVRGGAAAAEPAPAPQQEKDTRVYDYGYEGGDHAPAGDDAVWHVVINQDQVGPMTAVDVQQRFSGGEIDSETYVWREGFADWLPLAQVDTFASLASGSAPSAARSAGSEAVASMFGGADDAGAARSDPGDLFAAASASARDDDTGDLFGSKPSAAQASLGGTKLRGERNENSVLFSLNNLAQLASDKPAPAAAPPSATAPATATPGGAGGEGSGLIDIRSMANAYLGGPAGGPAKPASAGIGSIDDLPVFGGGGFSEPAVIVPMSARANPNKLMYALIGSVGLLAVAAVIVVIVLIKGNGRPAMVAAADKTESPPPPAPAVTTTTATDTGRGGGKPTEPKPPDPAVAPPPTDKTADNGSTPGAQPAQATPSTKSPDTDTKHAAVHKPPPSGSTPATTPRPKPPVDKPAPAAKEPPPPRETPKEAAKGDSCDEVSCVLNNYEGACCAKFRKGGGKSAGGGGGGGGGAKSDVPDQLDRDMISDGVAKVKARVMSCGEKSPAKGQVKLSVKVGADGHVVSVTVKNTPDAALSNCVAGMLQKATFPKTQSGGSFSIPYTF